jgi:hypothetical membrane protein
MTSKLAMTCALLGVTWLVAMVVIGGATYPGYDHVSQYISELGAEGAPHGWAVSWLGFLPIGILICAFAVLAWRAAPRSVLSALGFIGIFLFAVGYAAASYFRCDYECRSENPSFSQGMHELFGLAGYLGAPLALLLLGLAARKWRNASWLSILAFVCAPVALMALGSMTPDSDFLGLSQRVLEASVLSWVVACGLYINRAQREAPGA